MGGITCCCTTFCWMSPLSTVVLSNTNFFEPMCSWIWHSVENYPTSFTVRYVLDEIVWKLYMAQMRQNGPCMTHFQKSIDMLVCFIVLVYHSTCYYLRKTGTCVGNHINLRIRAMSSVFPSPTRVIRTRSFIPKRANYLTRLFWCQKWFRSMPTSQSLFL